MIPLIWKKPLKKLLIKSTRVDYFTLEKSEKEGYWIATHKMANIVVEFEQGKFNDTQKVLNIHDFSPSQYTKIPTYMRQLGDWLAQNYSHLIM